MLESSELLLNILSYLERLRVKEKPYGFILSWGKT